MEQVGEESWSISGEEIEEVEAFKYLDVFSWTKNERMAYVGALCLPKPRACSQCTCMGAGGKIANRKLEAVHEWVGRKLYGASTSVAGAAIRRDLGKQGKVLYGYTGLMTAGWSDR